ncbi:MAG: rhodanese-like domain-containing protein [Vicinamibacterales bacterium]
MFVKRFFEPSIAQTSYLIGCAAAGEAIVIDANRDVEQYIRAAAAENLAITHVTETHIHADFVSGSRELAARTGATLHLSDEGDADWKYQFAEEGRLIRSGDRIQVGKVTIEALHTPGHTPEHLTFLITDGAVADEPIAAATGDFIFVGDVGRPDLLERAAKVMGTMEASAHTLYRSLDAFKHREDWLQIWPGHGAGSACGKGISAVPHSTLGYERRFNWAFRAKDEDDFVRSVLAGQPDPPTYFATMKRVNKQGPAALGGRTVPARLDDHVLPELIAAGALVVDTRPATEYAAGFVPGTINIPLNSAFVSWAGWFVPAGGDVYLLFGDGAEIRLPEAVRGLSLIGVDVVAGWLGASAITRWAQSHAALGQVRQVAPAEAARLVRDGAVLVDVRSPAEWAEGHIPAARHIPLGALPERMAELPRDAQVVVQCQAGARSAIGASLLERAGFTDVLNLTGGLDAWTAQSLPLTSE